MGQSSYTSWIVRQRNRKGAYTNKWAVTWLPGNSRSSCERPSVRDLTAALDALYAALPLKRGVVRGCLDIRRCRDTEYWKGRKGA